MGEKRDIYTDLVGKPEERRPLGDPGVVGRTILKWIFRKWDVGHGLVDLTQDMNRLRALVDALMNLSRNCHNFIVLVTRACHVSYS
jgi:hypothetical protein